MDMHSNYPLIDKLSPIPAYQQIATDMINRIETEEWPVGYQLDNQNALAAYYGVALVTMRQALALLEKGGLIVRKQGRGAFVLENPKFFTYNILPPSLSFKADASKSSAESKDITIQLDESPDKLVREKLRIECNEPVFHLQRLLTYNSITIGLEHAWIPAHFTPGLATEGLMDNSVSKTLKNKYSIEVIDIENIVESIRINAYEASLLSVAYDDSALRIDTLHFINDKTVVEFARTIWLSRYTRLLFHVSK